jgi:hypothetical protein
MLSSCLGEPIKRYARLWWHYTQETARMERQNNQGRFQTQEMFEMETRRRAF